MDRPEKAFVEEKEEKFLKRIASFPKWTAALASDNSQTETYPQFGVCLVNRPGLKWIRVTQEYNVCSLMSAQSKYNDWIVISTGIRWQQPEI